MLEQWRFFTGQVVREQTPAARAALWAMRLAALVAATAVVVGLFAVLWP